MNVESAGFQKRLAAEKSRLLPEETGFIGVAAQVDAVWRAAADAGFAFFIDNTDSAAQDVDLRPPLEITQHVIQRSGSEAIVRIEIPDHIRGGGPEAFV